MRKNLTRYICLLLTMVVGFSLAAVIYHDFQVSNREEIGVKLRNYRLETMENAALIEIALLKFENDILATIGIGDAPQQGALSKRWVSSLRQRLESDVSAIGGKMEEIRQVQEIYGDKHPEDSVSRIVKKTQEHEAAFFDWFQKMGPVPQLAGVEFGKVRGFLNSLNQLERFHDIQYKKERAELLILARNDSKKLKFVFSIFILLGGLFTWRIFRLIHIAIKNQQKVEEEVRDMNENLEQIVTFRTSELHAAQEELVRSEKLSTLGKLTATVSHELRNPLAVIQNSVYLLRQKLQGVGPKQEKVLDRVERNIQRCSNIIEDMLEYTRTQPPEMHPMIFDEWLRGVLKEFSIPDDVQVVTDFSAKEGKVMLAEEKFYRVVMNLIENANQAMADSSSQEERGMSLLIATRLTGTSLHFTISDSGPGLEGDVQNKIFEPLFSTKSFGVGLGLPIVKQIIESHQGNIQLSNRDDGIGTVAHVTLPLTATEIANGQH